MKAIISIIFFTLSNSIGYAQSQIAERILNPDFSDFIVPQYLSEDEGILYCGTKVYENGIWRHYLALYSIENETFDVLEDFSTTSNIYWTNFANFQKFGTNLYFSFGSVLYKHDMTTHHTTQLITNYEFEGLIGKYIIYRGFNSDFNTFKIYDLESNQQVATFIVDGTTSGVRNIDAFHLENNKIYFFASRTAYQLHRYLIYYFNLETNQLSTIYSTQFNPNSTAITERSNVVKVGNNLIFTTKHAINSGRYISINLSTNQINTDFTFDVNGGVVNQLREHFVLGNKVYIPHENGTYESNGLDYPILSTIGDFTGSTFVSTYKNYFEYNNKIYTSIYDYDQAMSTIWSTNGLTKEILNQDISSSSNSNQAHSYNGKLYFVGRDLTNPLIQKTIFESDGTENGTNALFTGPNLTLLSLIFHYGNTIYFYGETSNNNPSDCGFYKIEVQSLSHNSQNTDVQINSYPNPVKNILYLDFSKQLEYLGKEFQILDLNGRVVFKDKINEIINAVDVSPLQKGLYYIKIDDTLMKFIKE